MNSAGAFCLSDFFISNDLKACSRCFSTTMTLVKILVLTKNEYDLIEPFLVYYGTLYGFENIVVLDNASTDPRVLDVYERFQSLGVTVRTEARPFEKVGEFTNEHICQIRDDPAMACEWMMLMETDEFAIWTPHAEDPSAMAEEGASAIRQFLEGLPDDVHIVQFGKVFNAAVNPKDAGYENQKYTYPPAQMTKFFDPYVDKNIVRLSSFDHVIQWPHIMASRGGRTIVAPEVGMLHYHATGARRLFERSRTIVEGCNFMDLNAPLQMQLPIMSHLMKMHVANYHRVAYYRKCIMRQWIVRTFEVCKGRLPTVQELLEVEKACWTSDDALEYVMQYMPVQKPAHSMATTKMDTNDLIFHEVGEAHDLEIRVVANFFRDFANPPKNADSPETFRKFSKSAKLSDRAVFWPLLHGPAPLWCKF
jgi:hypothetical protein